MTHPLSPDWTAGMTHHEQLLHALDLAVDAATNALHDCEDAGIEAARIAEYTTSLMIWLWVHHPAPMDAVGGKAESPTGREA